jgi:hypothetical protein
LTDDRRQRTVAERALERPQPIVTRREQRAEIAREGVAAAVGSDESVEGDRAYAHVPTSERLQSPLDLVELEQTAAATASPLRHLPFKPTPGPLS